MNYVIQKHSARKLHYDLRFEIDGVLRSFALPKSPPRIAGLKRLAIAVEDHALEYVDFEGDIESGYGKGKVEIYDRGTYELLEQRKNKLVVNLIGRKLKGVYCLIRLQNYKKDKHWLFFKQKER